MIGFVNTRRLAGVALAVALATLANVASAQQDRVVRKDGTEKTYKILSEDFGGLSVSLEGGTSVIRWKDVDSIKYQGADKYNKAVGTFNSGAAVDAVAQLEELTADAKLRPVLRHNSLYFLALSYQKSGAADKALATYQTLLKEFPKSRYLLQAGSNLLGIYLAKGDAGAAGPVLEGALAAAGTGSKDANLQAGLDLLRARLYEVQKGKLAEAETLYDRISTAAGADPELIAEGKLGRGRCAQAAGNRDSEAEQRYREIVVSDSPNTVIGGAWNGLGDLALAAGRKDKNADTLRDAAFAYLRAAVYYVAGRDGPSEERERGMAGAADAFQALGELESKADAKKQHLDRAKALRAQLASQYPQSRFIKK